MFHLLSHTDGEGGASLLVDSFLAAEILRREDRAAWDTLCKIRVPTHASGNEDVSVRPAYGFPVLNCDPQTGELVQVRWNNDDRAGFKGLDVDDTVQWYDAARKWVDVLRRERLEYWVQLEPGRALSKSLGSTGMGVG